MSVLAVSCLLFFQGCGGGGSDGGSGEGKPGENINDPAAKGVFKYDRISIAGSSITYGAGFLGEKSYVGEVIKYFRENIADTIGADELQNYDSQRDENMAYKGKLYSYSAGSEISGNLKASDEISIVAASEGVDAVVELFVDGVSKGEKSISGNFLPVIKPYPNAEQGGFRENNKNAVFTWGGLENKEHSFVLKVKQGNLLLNFITNHMYYFQNAGIGGYAASTFLMSGTKTTTKEIVDFDPELFIFESATNDAKKWKDESSGGSTNNWKLESLTTMEINATDKIKLPLNVNVEKGDVVVMGLYGGDIRNLAVGIVKNDSNSNIVTLEDPVPTNVQKYCKIKSIKLWEENVKKVIDRVKVGVGHPVTVGIATCGVPNYDRNNYPDYARRLMGYREKGIMLANDNNWMFFDFFKKLVNNGYVGIEANKGPNERWSKGDNTHPDVLGYGLFGEAITDVLKAQ
jgi:hypothetical protein